MNIQELENNERQALASLELIKEVVRKLKLDIEIQVEQHAYWEKKWNLARIALTNARTLVRTQPTDKPQ